MAGPPTIIGVGTNSKAYAPDVNNSGSTRVFSNVEIPATANTVLLHVGQDADFGSKRLNALTYSGLSNHKVVMDVLPTPTQNVRLTRFAVLDVSGAGAMTITVTSQVTNTAGANSGTSGAGILGVVCTDGFLQNVTLTSDRLMEHHKLMVHQGNSDNTTLVSMGVIDNVALDDITISTTGASEIYDTQSGNIQNIAAQQSTVDSDGFQTIVIASDDAADDMAHAIVLLTTLPDAFGGLTGTLTSPLVK